jgi:hypothetical protein
VKSIHAAEFWISHIYLLSDNPDVPCNSLLLNANFLQFYSAHTTLLLDHISNKSICLFKVPFFVCEHSTMAAQSNFIKKDFISQQQMLQQL